MKKYNIATGIIFLALSIFAYMNGAHLKAKLPTDPLGPGWWPKYLSIALAFFSVVLILQGLLVKKEHDKPAPFDASSPGFRRVVKLAALLVLFILATYLAGIYVGMLIMIPASMYLLGERNPKLIAVFTVCAIVFIYIVFRRLLMVPLPEGRLFG